MKKQAVIDFENSLATSQLPDFAAGDTVSVHYKIDEGGKERIQVFKGVVINRRGEGMGEHFTVRKLTQGHGIERCFPTQSPFIDKIDLERRGKVRRAKLFYLRDRTGKATRIAEKLASKKQAE
jgi:large subunit ribosomal protein L19